jgi:hypothetical protein
MERRDALKSIAAFVGGAAAVALIPPDAKAAQSPTGPATLLPEDHLKPDDSVISMDRDLLVFKLGTPEHMPTEDDMFRFLSALAEARETGRLIAGPYVTVGGADVPYSVEVFNGFWDSKNRGLYIFKLGSDSRYPTQEEKEDFSKILNVVQENPGACLVYHHELTVEFIPSFFQQPYKVVA